MENILVNGINYQIVKLLGKGKGGYSYLALKDNKYFVVKQIHHEPCEYYNFGNKIESENNDYKRLLETGIALPKMIDIDFEKLDSVIHTYVPSGRDVHERSTCKISFLNSSNLKVIIVV